VCGTFGTTPGIAVLVASAGICPGASVLASRSAPPPAAVVKIAHGAASRVLPKPTCSDGAVEKVAVNCRFCPES
jgi:hypothetical protein